MEPHLKRVLSSMRDRNLIIGLIYKIDSQHVKEHPSPEPEEIKNNLITSADVT